MTKEAIKRRDELTGEIGEEGDKVVTAARTVGTIVKCLLVRCDFCEKLEGLKFNCSATLRFIIKTANGRSFVRLNLRVA